MFKKDFAALTIQVFSALILLVAAGGCGVENPAAPDVGSLPETENAFITGTISRAAGETGDFENALVSIYESMEAFEFDIGLVRTNVKNGRFSAGPIAPGTYYVTVWRDNDRNWMISPGDLYAYYGDASTPGSSPVPVTVGEGQTITIKFVIGEPAIVGEH